MLNKSDLEMSPFTSLKAEEITHVLSSPDAITLQIRWRGFLNGKQYVFSTVNKVAFEDMVECRKD